MLFVLHNMTPEERSKLSGNYLERSLEEIHRMSPEERAEMERLDTVGILQLEKEWMASLIKDMTELDSKVRNTEPTQSSLLTRWMMHYARDQELNERLFELQSQYRGYLDDDAKIKVETRRARD